jgi:hypothetical protein
VRQHTLGATVFQHTGFSGTGTVPSLGTTYFSDGFETGDFSHTDSGYYWGARQAGSETPTISSAISYAGTYSMKFVFEGGNDADDALSETRFVFGANLSEVYLTWYQYFPDGTEGLGSAAWTHRDSGGANNNKYLRLWAGTDDDYSNTNAAQCGFSTEYWSSFPGTDRLIREYRRTSDGVMAPHASLGEDDDYQINRFVPLHCALGAWSKVQVQAKTDDGGVNGILRVWVNDVLAQECLNLPMYASGKNYWTRGYLMGWANSGFASTTHTYIDDFTISDYRI